VPADAHDDAAAGAYAARGPTISPDATADEARDVTLGLATRRLPVVDERGALVGIVAIDEHLTKFCGT
jgi:CBS domain-containing protein